MISLSKIINFADFLWKFNNVERVVRVPGKPDEWENDTEHTYQLTMLAWYISEANNLNLDKNLLIKYGLVHDLVETYSGDTYIYSEDKDLLSSKAQREHDALLKIKEEFGDAPEMISYIEKYENKEDIESKFIYALDKIQPVLTIYLGKGVTWKEMNITVDMLIEHKKDKVAISPEIEFYFHELISLLKNNEWQLFG